MHKDISPEERLLALIKKKGKDKKIPSQDISQDTEAKVTRHEIIAKRESRLFKNKIFDPKTLRYVNRYMSVILAILVLYFMFDLSFRRPNTDIQRLVTETADSRAAATPSGEPVKGARDFSSYSRDIQGKNIFAPPSKEGGEVRMSSKDAQEIAGNLSLVGIIAGDSPQAVIEDKKSQKTYYVTKDQSFDGFTVEEISSGKVVLDYGGRKITLVL